MPRERIRLALDAFRVSGRNRELRRIQLARLMSVTGRWAYAITLAVFAYAESGAGGVALAGIVRLAPSVATAPLAGALIRRVALHRLLNGGGMVRTAALAAAGVAVLSGWPTWAVYALVAVEAAASTFMRPLQNSLLPALAHTADELTSANLTLSVIESAGLLLGPLAGALLLNGTGEGTVFIIAAGAYLVSALLLLPIRVPSAGDPDDRPVGFLREATAGARAVFANADSRVVVGLYGIQNVVSGALNVLIVVVAIRLLHTGQSGVGFLTAAVGAGGVIGGTLTFSRLRRGHHGADLGLGLALTGVPLALIAPLSFQASAYALLGVVGIGITLVDVAAVTLLQRSSTGETLPHALGLLQGVFVGSVAVGTVLAPGLVSALGVRGALVATGAALPAMLALTSVRVRRLDTRGPAMPDRVALLRAVPIFAPLSDLIVEHLATSMREVSLAAGDVVFAQGAHGDGFYVVRDGEVAVLVDGARVRTLGPGGYFGEIALLRDIPRTATVRATRDCGLLRLDRPRFLAVVAGNPASASAAEVVVGSRLAPRSGFATL